MIDPFFIVKIQYYYSKTGGAPTDAQLDALVELIRGIQAEVQRIYGHTIPFDRAHIVGHCEITPLTRPHCPGEKFPWDKLMARLNEQEALPGEDAPLYRVQVGAFRSKANADALCKELQASKYDAFVTSDAGLYRVQVGAFHNKTNAEALRAKMAAKGYRAFVVER